MGYNVEFEHINGKNNVFADILSRKFARITQQKLEHTSLILEEISQDKRV